MLYLEDYLEMIEQLPMDLRERFTEIREMDLQVQNSVDNLDGRVKTFFDSCRKDKVEKKEQLYSGIRKDYYKTLEDANEKVQMTNQIYEQVDRHLRKLDQELAKFKMELEADNAGITEVLERRSLDLDKPIPGTGQHVTSRGEKRKHHNTENHSEKKIQQAQEKLALASVENLSGNISSGQSSSNNSVKNESKEPVSSSASSTTSLSYNLGTVGAASSNPLALAAAQAVSNTLQMNQGRRTASFKASFEALRSVGFDPTIITKEFTIGTTSPASSTETTRSQRQRKQTAKAQALWEKHQAQQERHHQLQQLHQQQVPPLTDAPDAPLVPPLPEDPNVTMEWTYDPNEPRYCICNQVSYGEMVGCDNPSCPIEWFHYGCVGILNPPKGKWYCPQCTASMKRRERKESQPEKEKKKEKGH